MSKLEITEGLDPPEFHKEDFVDCSIDLETVAFDPSLQYGSWCRIGMPNSSDQILYIFAVLFNFIPTEFMPMVEIITNPHPIDKKATIGWKYTPEKKNV